MAVYVYFRPGNGDAVEVWLETEKKVVGSFAPQALLDACPIDWDTLKVHPDEVTDTERAALQAYGVELWNVLGKDKFTRMVAKQRQPVIFEVAEELADNQVLFEIPWEAVYSDTRYGKYKPTFVARTHPFERANWNGSLEILQKFLYRMLLLSSRIYTLDEMDVLRTMYVNGFVNLAPDVQAKVLERLMQPDMLPQAEETREQYLKQLYKQAQAVGLEQTLLAASPELVEVTKRANKLANADEYDAFEADRKAEKARLEKKLEAARATGDYREQAEILNTLALFHYDIQPSVAVFAEAVQAAEKTNDVKLEVEMVLGYIEILKEAWEVAAYERDPDDESDAIEYQQIIELLTPLVNKSVDLDDQLLRYDVLLELGYSHLKLEEYEQARAYLETVSENPVNHKDYISLELRAVAALRTAYKNLGDAAKVKVLSTRIKRLDAAMSKRLQEAFDLKR